VPNYRADPDIRAILSDGVLKVPSDLDPAEAERLDLFLRRDQVLEGYYSRGQQPPTEDLIAAAMAAMAVYDERTDRLSVGWQKFAVLQAGLAGIDLDSGEIMEWAYRLCKGNAGWLGNFDDDIDREMPLRAMMQAVPATSIIHFSGGG